MKSFKEFSQMLDEDGGAVGIGGGPTNVAGGVAVGPNDIGVDTKLNRRRNKLIFPVNPILQPMITRAT